MSKAKTQVKEPVESKEPAKKQAAKIPSTHHVIRGKVIHDNVVYEQGALLPGGGDYSILMKEGYVGLLKQKPIKESPQSNVVPKEGEVVEEPGDVGAGSLNESDSITIDDESLKIVD